MMTGILIGAQCCPDRSGRGNKLYCKDQKKKDVYKKVLRVSFHDRASLPSGLFGENIFINGMME